MRLAGYRRHFGQSTGSLPPGAFDNDVDKLVDEAMKAALAGEVRGDITFGEYASLFGFFRSAVMQEGRLLELAIGQAVQKNPDLKLLPTTAMPIVPAAQEMLKRTPSDEIKGVRFPSRVHSTETYKPDLFVVNRTKHSGLILDIKRSLGSYRPQEVDRLRFRMLAVAAIAPEWVAEHRGPLLVKIETAIVDGADQVSDPERGVFRSFSMPKQLSVAFRRQHRSRRYAVAGLLPPTNGHRCKQGSARLRTPWRAFWQACGLLQGWLRIHCSRKTCEWPTRS
ncbi:hypothetical protein GCM10007881_26890 [Mesorhizobium huakuii]|nr:hypothetical protein GCM10007881_26890 [Mesorhizobium huakuii]